MTADLQRIVNAFADQIGLPVLLEDANQQLMVYSPHYELTDRMREETILRRTTSQRIVDWFGRFDLGTRAEPFVVPGEPDRGVLPRLCVPVRYLDTSLGFAWVLLRDEAVPAHTVQVAREVAVHLSQVMLAESRTRIRESDSLVSLVSPDAHTRIQGLIDVESRGGFDPPRTLLVAVVTGPDWDDAGVRGAFWTATWTLEPQHQMRGVTPRDGIVLMSLRASGADDAGMLVRRALSHVVAGRSGNPARLVVGIGPSVAGADQAHEAYRRGRLAARVALRDTGAGPVAWWDHLGVYRFLSQLPTHALVESLDPRIAPLVDDRPELARTLECYLEKAGAITAVAGALHIHRTTLYYRLERLAGRGIDVGDGEDRLAAHTSLAALRLLGRWPPPEPDATKVAADA